MKLTIRLAVLAAASLLVTLQAPARATEAPAASRSGSSPEALALAHTIVDTAFPPERRQEMMDKLMKTMGDQMKASMPAALMEDPGLARIMTEYLENLPATLRPATTAFMPRQMEAVAQAYARMFTVAELNDIAAFARTPSGKNYLQRSTDLLSDPAVAAVNSEYFAQAQTLIQPSAAELGRKVGEYMKQHPDVAKTMAERYQGSAAQ